jgi:hypothetical protein
MRVSANICAAALVALASGAAVSMPSAQTPAARRVMLDEAHHNIMATASGGYRPLVRLLTDAEYVVTPNRLPFSRGTLATTDVVITANPNGADEQASPAARAASAFSDSEIDAVDEWVRGGGGLLRATDHYPTGAAARRLAERVGVKLSGGWTDDPANRRMVAGPGPMFGQLVFSLENGLLTDHAITRGRYDTEQIEGVSTVIGESIEGPPGSVALLRLSPTAVDWIPSRAPLETLNSDSRPPSKDFNPCPSCDHISAAGRSQAVAFVAGRGRVVVVAEMGSLIDYTVPGMQNAQFALNIVRWLSREF